MTVLMMAVIGFALGFVLDELIARLAREPYERGEMDEDGFHERDDAAPLDTLSSEHGAMAMPRALTTASMYRRVIVIAATALIFALIGTQYEGDALHVAIVAGYAAALIVCTGTDVLAYRVPNVITYPAIIAAIVIGLVMSGASNADVLAGGFLTGGTFLAMNIVTRGGMGMGDVKLAFFTGFALGLEYGIGGLVITAIAGGVIAIVLLLTHVRDRRDPIPYAPFIAAGALFIMLTRGTAFVSL